MKRIISLFLFILLSNTLVFSASIVVEYKCGDTNPITGQIKPHLNIMNTGTASVPLGEITARYYYTEASTISEEFSIDYAAMGSSLITVAFQNGYLEIGFTSGAGSLSAGAQTGEIQIRIYKSDWTMYDQSDDYSFDSTKTAYSEWDHITLYQNGTLIYGIPPESDPTPTPVPANTDTPGPTGTLNGAYILHISEYNNSHIPIIYSGDLSGTGETPFYLSSDSPFTVTLSAPYSVPNIESSFDCWILDWDDQTPGSSGVTVIVDDTASERTAQARYFYGSPPPAGTSTPAPDSYTLEVIINGIYGTVTLDPPGGTYSGPTVVTLTAHNYSYPDGAVEVFTNWGGDLTSFNNPETILVDGPKVVDAYFVHGDPTPPPHIIHITSDTFPVGEGNIPVTFTGNYNGSGTTPFDIGPYINPFTVTLSAPETRTISGSTNTLICWVVNGINQYPSPITDMTISTTSGTVGMNVLIQYAHVEPTPIPDPGANSVWIKPAEKTVRVGEDFTLEIHLNTGNRMVAAYGFELSWIMPQEGAILYVDTSIGTNGVEAGPDGFVSAVNANDPGILTISGFDVNGKGPGSDLHFLTVHFTAGPQAASTPVDINVETLVDQNTDIIGTPHGIGATVTVVDILPGDVNDNGTVDIVDALLTAQHYVGLNPASFNPAAADVNCDGSIDIVDALLIAQYYVGLVTQFC